MTKKQYQRPFSQTVSLQPEGLIAASGGGTTSIPIKPDENVDESDKSPASSFGTSTGWSGEE